MEEKKVFKFLRTFGKRQLNRFEDYVNSPYFNKSEELCFIYEVVKKYVLSSDKKNFQQYLSRQFPVGKKPISSTNLDKYLSRIFQLALDFVAMERYKNDAFLKSSLLMEYLIKVDELGMFQKTYSKAKNVLSKEKISFKNYRRYFLLEELNFVNAQHQNNRVTKNNLQLLTDLLDKYYLAHKFNLEVFKLSYKTETNAEYKFHILSKLIDLLPKTEFNKDVLVSIWFKVCNILYGDIGVEKKEYLSELQKALNEHGEVIDDEMVFNLSIIIQNFARTIYKNNGEYYSFLFNLYKNQIKTASIYLDEKILDAVFKNIVEVCININELDWVERFIKDHSNKIEPENIAFDITNYSLARVYFYKGNYNKTQNIIANLHFKDVYYKMSLKKLELMLYFELGEYIYLDSLIKAFRVALTPERNENLINSSRLIYKKFITYLTKLSKLYRSHSKINESKIIELENNINKTNLIDKRWLLEKLNSLKSEKILT